VFYRLFAQIGGENNSDFHKINEETPGEVENEKNTKKFLKKAKKACNHAVCMIL